MSELQEWEWEWQDLTRKLVKLLWRQTGLNEQAAVNYRSGWRWRGGFVCFINSHFTMHYALCSMYYALCTITLIFCLLLSSPWPNTMISSTLLHPRPSFKFNASFKHIPSYYYPIGLKPFPTNPKFKNNNLLCSKAVFSDDAPFAAAIGACMFTSLLLPVPASPQDDDADSPTDSRLAVMGILSFIPYFNWLVRIIPFPLFNSFFLAELICYQSLQFSQSWVFAWLDTGKRRYAVYSLVYLAPYLRFISQFTNTRFFFINIYLIFKTLHFICFLFFTISISMLN